MNVAETAITFSASEAGNDAPTNNALIRCELSGTCTVVGDSTKMPQMGGMAANVWSVTQN